MKIKKHVVGIGAANCYLVWDEVSKEGTVIDPGWSAKKIAATIKEKKVKLKAIVQTHRHWDHTAAALALQRATGAPLLRHPKDHKTGLFHKPARADGDSIRDIGHNDEIALGAQTLRVIHTPGHTQGSICLWTEVPGAHLLFAGDLLFKGSVGRWDLAGGDYRALIESLTRSLAHLPDDTDVFPGHGPATTLGAERRNNPFFRKKI